MYKEETKTNALVRSNPRSVKARQSNGAKTLDESIIVFVIMTMSSLLVFGPF